MKRKLDDVSKRLESLYDLLRENRVSKGSEDYQERQKVILINIFSFCSWLQTRWQIWINWCNTSKWATMAMDWPCTRRCAPAMTLLSWRPSCPESRYSFKLRCNCRSIWGEGLRWRNWLNKCIYILSLYALCCVTIYPKNCKRSDVLIFITRPVNRDQEKKCRGRGG